ncbi:calpain small subunit 1-like [Eucyclogobius newberryi]|uniref:calpain small subunit 1-like n=1 Tax=Eucyclogobius newberryi TaxID=166745 RepID=UPI003B5CB53F
MNLIVLMDTDRRMRMMNFEEFSKLWEMLNKYKQIFLDADANHNGVLSKDELDMAVRAAGLDGFSAEWGGMAMFRYSFGTPSMDLQTFLTLMIRMDQMTGFFNSRASEGTIILSMDDVSEKYITVYYYY